jgi:acyl-CoA synthetase (NDP forming)
MRAPTASFSPFSDRPNQPEGSMMSVDPEQLRRMLSPRSIAVVGASGRSRWSTMLMNNVAAYDFPGEMHLVNPKGGEAFGRPVHVTCQSIGAPIDTALLLVSRQQVPDAMRDAAAAGAAGVVVLAAGFGEAGEEGRRDEANLVELSQALDLLVLGPNGIGFANLQERVPAWLGPAPLPFLPGPVALISQSGNVGTVAGNIATRQGVGISHIVSTGNESVVTLVDVAALLVEDPAVKVLALFAESIARPKQFRAMALRAAALGKPVVVLKIGRSELSQRLAATHTGALVGDDAVINAAFRSCGVIRVDSLEELVMTAGLLAATGPLPPGGLGVVSVSGGINDIVADRSEHHGVSVPELGDEAKARIESLDLPFFTAQNPLDITGAGGRMSAAWIEPIRAMLGDEAVALVGVAGFERLAHPEDATPAGVDLERFGWVAEAFAEGSATHRGFILLSAFQSFSKEQLDTLDEMGAPIVLPGVESGLSAVGHAMRWSRWLAGRSDEPAGASSTQRASALSGRVASGSWTEHEALAFLAEQGFPVVPATLARSTDEAALAASEHGLPVAVKIASAQIPHKTEMGGVRLDLRSMEEVEEATREVVGAAERLGIEPDGVIVSPMRSSGIDMILGVVRDPGWGLLLVVGAGGVHAEALPDTSSRLLPVSQPEVLEMLGSLRMAPLFGGVRGEAAVDLDQLARVIRLFADIAGSAGEQLMSMEVNPLRIRGTEVEALDALVEWRT